MYRCAVNVNWKMDEGFLTWGTLFRSDINAAIKSWSRTPKPIAVVLKALYVFILMYVFASNAIICRQGKLALRGGGIM